MAQTAAQGKPVIVQTPWFRSSYAHGVSGVKGMPNEPTEQAIVSVFQRVLSIYCDDGEVSQEQLRYEAGLLTGYLLRSVG